MTRLIRQAMYRIRWKILPKIKWVSKFPTHIDIESTNACNLRCKMCARDFMTEKIGYIEFNTVKAVLDSCIPYSVKFNWRGEPLLHKDIAYYIKYAKFRGVHEVSFNTNGLGLTQELAEQLIDAGLDWLIISVDGATKETYESIRTGGDFEKLFKKIVHTAFIFSEHDNSPKIRIQICKQPSNEHEIGRWRELFSPYADQLRVGKLHDPQGKRGYKSVIPQSCPQPWQRLTVDWKGNIYPCPSDYQGHKLLGNIYDTSIHSAWHSPRMQYIRYNLALYGRSSVALCRKCSSYC